MCVPLVASFGKPYRGDPGGGKCHSCEGRVGEDGAEAEINRFQGRCQDSVEAQEHDWEEDPGRHL